MWLLLDYRLVARAWFGCAVFDTKVQLGLGMVVVAGNGKGLIHHFPVEDYRLLSLAERDGGRCFTVNEAKHVWVLPDRCQQQRAHNV